MCILLLSNQPEKCLKLLNDNITSKTQKLGVETFMTVIRHLSLTGVENVFDGMFVFTVIS